MAACVGRRCKKKWLVLSLKYSRLFVLMLGGSVEFKVVHVVILIV